MYDMLYSRDWTFDSPHHERPLVVSGTSTRASIQVHNTGKYTHHLSIAVSSSVVYVCSQGKDPRVTTTSTKPHRPFPNRNLPASTTPPPPPYMFKLVHLDFITPLALALAPLPPDMFRLGHLDLTTQGLSRHGVVGIRLKYVLVGIISGFLPGKFYCIFDVP